MTRRLQEKTWKDFKAWCRVRNLRPLPAHPWTVAAFVRWCEPRHDHSAIVAAVKAISREHVLKCHPSPDKHSTVIRTLRLIEVKERTKDARSCLYRDEDFLKPGETAPAPSAAKETPSRRKVKRTLRSTPRLVSRRRK